MAQILSGGRLFQRKNATFVMSFPTVSYRFGSGFAAIEFLNLRLAPVLIAWRLFAFRASRDAKATKGMSSHARFGD